MSYSVQLYKNSSNPNVLNKSISLQATVTCEFKAPMDRERPTIYISATDAYDGVNYVYIPEFGRYYFANCIGGTSQTLTFECLSDPLMSFKSGILSSPAVIARNPWHYDKYIHDDKLPVESRVIKSVINFPQTGLFSGDHKCYILTTLGSGAGDN